MTVAGLLLAAGAGRRMGTPKALVDDWLVRGVATLRDGGCDTVTVVLGAAVEEAVARLEGTGADHVVAQDWHRGMSASLAAGLAALGRDGRDGVGPPEVAVVSLVDLPDVGPAVLRRLLAEPRGAATLARASYAEGPGHPVLLGRDHWAGVRAAATGDRGARDYLRSHPVELVDCSDLATGRDVDSR